MTSNRQIVSDVVGELRANNITDRIPYRLVLSMLRDSMGNFVKQDSDNRRLFKQSDLWITLPCVNTEEVDVIECNADIIGCDTIRRTIIRVPETYATIYGQAIRVLNVKSNVEYHQIQQGDYQDIKNRRYRDKRLRYFWIDGNHIYIPDSDVEQIRILGFFKKPEEVYQILNRDNGCIKPLNIEFRCPDYLFSIVKKDTVQELLKTYRSITPSSIPDLDERQRPEQEHK